MRQGENPRGQLHAMQQQRTGNLDLEAAQILSMVTDDNRTDVLKSHSRDALCNHIEKKGLAVRFITLVNDIIADIKKVDHHGGTDLMVYVESITAQWPSKYKVKSIKNEELIPCILSLFTIAESITHMLNEMQQQQQDMARTTRNARPPALTPTQEFYRDLCDLKSRIDSKIVQDALSNQESAASSKLLKGLTVERSMIGRLFDNLRIPQDPAERQCPFCLHYSLNELEEDEGNVSYNDNLYRQHETLTTLWDNFVKARDVANAKGERPPPFPTNPFNNNQAIKRSPPTVTAKQLKKSRYFCLCRSATCGSEGTTVGSTCFILCRECSPDDERGVSAIANDTTLSFFPWAQGNRGVRCTCPICMCQCNKLFNVDDMQSIGVLMMQQARQPQRVVRPPDQTSQFMAQAMLSARQVVNDSTSAAHQRGTEISHEHEDEIYNTAMADHAVRLGGSYLSLTTRHQLGHGFGRDTVVQLPNGQSFDTRSISSNANAHANNNRISAGATARSVIRPGMRDKLNPSYTCLSAPFLAASSNPNSLVSTINSLAQSSDYSVASSSMNTTRSSVSVAASSSACVDMTGVVDDDDDNDDDGRGGMLRATYRGGKRRATTTGNDNNNGCGGKRRNSTAGDDNDDGGGKPRANTPGNDDCVVHLSQTSTGSDPEVVKVRGRNILDYTANRSEFTPIQRKVAVKLTKNLSRPYDSATINHLASIREEEYDTPQKVEALRNSIEDDMI